MKFKIFSVHDSIAKAGDILEKKVSEWLGNTPISAIKGMVQSESNYGGTGTTIHLTVFYF